MRFTWKEKVGDLHSLGGDQADAFNKDVGISSFVPIVNSITRLHLCVEEEKPVTLRAAKGLLVSAPY